MEREREQPQRTYTMQELIALNPYNPDLLPELEAYVQEQVMSNFYNLEANLCLLRLYQFEPLKMSMQIVGRILVKALMAMPAPDFNLCMFLIPEKVQMVEPFITLITLSHYLETARFREFWDAAARNRDILEVVPGFEQAMQKYAIHVLSLTYRKVPRHVLAEAVNVEGIVLDRYLEARVAEDGWSVETAVGKGQIISLPANQYNHPELKKNSADNIPLEHVARIFPLLT